MVYQEDSNPGGATVIKYNDTSWVTVGVRGFSIGWDAFNPTIAIDKNGIPFVAYEQEDYGSVFMGVTVMKYDGIDWVLVGDSSFTAGYANFPNLALDSAGTPYVVYEDGGNDDKASVMKYDGSSWVYVGSPGFSQGAAGWTCIAFDKSNTPFVAFQDSVNSYKTTVMKYNGVSWETVGSAGFSSGLAKYLSLAIDQAGTPYLAYSDYAHGAKATVMKYVGDTTTSINNLSENNFTIYPNPSTGKFNISSTQKINTLQLYDMEGRLVFTQTVQSNNAIINLSHLANGVYNARVLCNGETIDKKLVITK